MGHTSISRRLSIGFGVMVCLLAIITAISLVSMQNTQHRVTVISDELSPKVELVGQMKQQVNQIAMSMRNLGILTTPEDLEKEYKRLTSAYASYDAVSKQFAQHADAEKALLASLDSARKDASVMFQSAVEKAGSAGTVQDIAVLIRLELRTNLEAWSASQDTWLRTIDQLQHQVSQ